MSGPHQRAEQACGDRCQENQHGNQRGEVYPSGKSSVLPGTPGAYSKDTEQENGQHQEGNDHIGAIPYHQKRHDRDRHAQQGGGNQQQEAQRDDPLWVKLGQVG